MLYIMIANIICLLIGVLSNFILPRFLSIDSYAIIKTYTLYISYAGFLTLGYSDGMYFKYGGRSIRDLSSTDVGSNFKCFLALQIVLGAGVFIVATCMDSVLLQCLAFGMLGTNLLSYLSIFLQATGEFKDYGVILSFEKIVVFIANMVCLLLVRTDNANIYILILVAAALGVSVLFIIKLQKNIPFLGRGRLKAAEFKENISMGFILMLGNFSSTLFTGMDRWFVKTLLATADFAMFSFAVSMESMLNVFMSPITVSMYNYFCKKPAREKIFEIKQMVILWGFIAILAAFPAKWVLENFLQTYLAASSVLFILFAAQVFYVVVRGIHVNIYKANRQQKRYLYQMVLMTVVAFVLNLILYYLFKNMVAIAAGTLLTAMIWFVLCELRSDQIRVGIREILFIGIMLTIYLICGYSFNAVVGCLVYLVSGGLVGLLLMRKSLLLLLDTVKTAILQLLGRQP